MSGFQRQFHNFSSWDLIVDWAWAWAWPKRGLRLEQFWVARHGSWKGGWTYKSKQWGLGFRRSQSGLKGAGKVVVDRPSMRYMGLLSSVGVYEIPSDTAAQTRAGVRWVAQLNSGIPLICCF